MNRLNKIHTKLQRNDGMSFLVALVAFLVAAMVSAVIVAAAYSNVKQQANDKVTQQDLLTMQSTCDLLTSKIADGDTYLEIVTVKTYATASDYDSDNPDKTTTTYSAGGFLKKDLESTAVKTALDSQTNYTGGLLNIKSQVGGTSGKTLNAKATFVLYAGTQEEESDSYRLTMTVTPQSSSGSATAYTIVSFKSDVTTSPDESRSAKKRTTTVRITWPSSGITYTQPTETI